MTAALAWTSVGIATGYRGNTRVSTARAMAHGASTACHGCGLGTCRGSVRGKLRVTNHGNPRKSAAIATAISADAEPQQFSRPSAAIATAILRYAAMATEVRGSCHGNSTDVKPQQFSRPSAAILRYTAIATKVPAIATANSTAFRGHPRQLNYNVNRRQFTCNHGSCNGNPR